MISHRHTGVWLECDGPCCTAAHGWPEDGPCHFDTEAAALAYVLGDAGMGWTRLPDGRLLCRSCSEDADCAVTGHQPSAWHHNPGDRGIQWRVCTHCGGAFEQRRTDPGGAANRPLYREGDRR